MCPEFYTDHEDCANVSRASVLLNSKNYDILITSFPPAVILTDRFTTCTYFRTKAKCQMLHTVYIVYCVLYIVYCILYIVYCILYPVYCVLYIVHCILYTVYCVLYIVYCVLYIV